jgi:hypothetical protein
VSSIIGRICEPNRKRQKEIDQSNDERKTASKRERERKAERARDRKEERTKTLKIAPTSVVSQHSLSISKQTFSSASRSSIDSHQDFLHSSSSSPSCLCALLEGDQGTSACRTSFFQADSSFSSPLLPSSTSSRGTATGPVSLFVLAATAAESVMVAVGLDEVGGGTVCVRSPLRGEEMRMMRWEKRDLTRFSSRWRVS